MSTRADPERARPSPVPLPVALALLRRLPLPRRLGLLERLYGRALGRCGTAWVQTAAGVPWKLDLTDVTQRWIVYGDYEGNRQMDWCRRWLAHGGVMVDSGASIGQMLLHLAPLPGVRVHAFEPVPESAGWLEENLAAQPGWPVRVERAALSDAAGTVELQVAGPHSTSRLDWYPHRHLPRLRVAATRLDDYAAAQHIDRVRLWKLDVEGAEEAALRGAAGLLAGKRVDALLVEVSPTTWAAVSGLLGELGYAPARVLRGARLAADATPPSGAENRVFTPGTAAGPGTLPADAAQSGA